MRPWQDSGPGGHRFRLERSATQVPSEREDIFLQGGRANFLGSGFLPKTASTVAKMPLGRLAEASPAYSPLSLSSHLNH